MASMRAVVVAVVPTFRPGSDVLDNVDPLFAQCRRVIVVDDGSGDAADDVLTALEGRGADVVRLGRNGGIAAALNVGVQRALDDSSTDYVLTVDQDTRISDEFVVRATDKHRTHRAAGTVGIVVPGFVSGRAVRASGRSGEEELPMEPIQSGMLIGRQVFAEIGFFREEFFIDCVDTDFFLRAANGGFLTVLCSACSLQHELGTTRATLPSRPGIAVHPAFRRYYITRNRLVLMREHGWRDTRWLRYTIFTELAGLALVLALDSRRRAQMRAVLAGLRAFRTSSLGPIPPDVRATLER